MNLLPPSLFFLLTFWKYSMNDFSFMGMLLDQGTYLQAHLWHLSLVFQQPWEEVMHSSLCWVKDNLRNGEIRYFTLNHNQPPCDRNFSSNPGPCPVSDVIREEDYGLTIAVAQEWETYRVWTRKRRLRPVLLWPGQLKVRSSLQTPWHLSRSLPDLRVCLKAEWASAGEETLPPQALNTTQGRGVLFSFLVWATTRGRELPFWNIQVEQHV